jgi:hypothetical protein
MNNDPTKTNDSDIPASLRRRKTEPHKILHMRIALSQWQELADLGHEYNQDVSTFIREAIEDWLRRARKARQAQNTEGE